MPRAHTSHLSVVAVANKPHKIDQAGNGLFAHVPASFADDETENWANRTFVLPAGKKWQMAPIDATNPFNKVVCIGDPQNSVHVALTVNKEVFDDQQPNAEFTTYNPDAN